MKLILLILSILIVNSTSNFLSGSSDSPYIKEVLPQNSSVQPWVPKTYKLNMSLPYKEMWRELITDKKQELQNTITYMLSSIHINPLKQNFITSMISSVLKHYHNQDFVDEVQAVADLAEIPFYDMFLVNFAYELGSIYKAENPQSKSCTDSTQNIFHGRNWDFAFQYYLANISAIGEFYKNDKLIYKGMVLAGSLGVITGMKPNAFSISINARNNMQFWEVFYEMVFRKQSYNVQYFIRKVLEEETDFVSATQRLQTAELDNSVYVIIAGANYNEGQVIARNPQSIEDVATLDGQQQWFLVQTNYDRDQPDPINDYRRIPAQNKLDELGYNEISIESLQNNIMTQFPTNNDNTILTVVMSAQLNYFNCTMWK